VLDLVNSVSMHQAGEVLATASGQRAFTKLNCSNQTTDLDGVSEQDNSLKLWHHVDVLE